MGRTTCDITRNDALTEILKHLLSANNNVIENVLEELVGEELGFNFMIVDNYDSDWRFKYKDYGPFNI